MKLVFMLFNWKASILFRQLPIQLQLLLPHRYRSGGELPGNAPMNKPGHCSCGLLLPVLVPVCVSQQDVVLLQGGACVYVKL